MKMYEIEGQYVYQDAHGSPKLRVTRAIDRETKKKIFWQDHYENGQWLRGGYKGELAPYNHPKWRNTDDPIFWLEGEKKSERLAKEGFCISTSPGGAKSWRPNMAKFLTDRDVIFLGDNDKAGGDYVEKATRDIAKYAKSMKVVELPGLGEAEDVYDWLERGGTKEEDIRDDIRNWINQHGPERNKLKLPSGLTADQYSQRMSSYLTVYKNGNGSIHEATDIECVHHPIKVQGHEKVCRFDDESGPKITCYYEGFLDQKTMSEEGQYRLIHHEYAGLAGPELPDGPQSTYPISDQIAGSLQFQIVKKLVVKFDGSGHYVGRDTFDLTFIQRLTRFHFRLKWSHKIILPLIQPAPRFSAKLAPRKKDLAKDHTIISSYFLRAGLSVVTFILKT